MGLSSAIKSAGSKIARTTKNFGNWMSNGLSAAGTNFQKAGSYVRDKFDDFNEAAFGLRPTDDLSQMWNGLTGKTAADQFERTQATAEQQYKEQFDYLKEQNQLANERADNAYQRAMADMMSAGLNPLNGVNPSEIGTQGGTVGEYNGSPTASQSASDPLSFGGSLINAALSNTTNWQIAKLNADTQKDVALINASARGDEGAAGRAFEKTEAEEQREWEAEQKKLQQQHEAELQKKQHQHEAEQNKAQQEKTAAETEDIKYETNYKKTHGYSNATPTEVKIAKEATQAALEAARGEGDVAKLQQATKEAIRHKEDATIAKAIKGYINRDATAEEVLEAWEAWNKSGKKQSVKKFMETWVPKTYERAPRGRQGRHR